MGLLFVKQEELNSRDCLIYACDTMPEGTLFKKAEREGNDETAIDIYLKVGENQGVFVLRDGKIYEFSFLKGIFKIDPTLPPSRIFGKLPKEALDVNSALQHTFPQFSDGDYIYFVNLVPQTEIEFITDEPFTFYVNNKYDPLYIAGSYFVKIFDPFKLFVKIVRNKENCYTLTETFINRITSDVLLGLQEKTIC